MALSRCSSNTDDNSDVSDTSVARDLRRNIGRVVTIFTTSGGCSGSGFTGLVSAVNNNSCRLITELSSAPRNPFGVRSGANNVFSGSRCRESRFGTACVIPLDRICAVVSNDI